MSLSLYLLFLLYLSHYSIRSDDQLFLNSALHPLQNTLLFFFFFFHPFTVISPLLHKHLLLSHGQIISSPQASKPTNSDPQTQIISSPISVSVSLSVWMCLCVCVGFCVGVFVGIRGRRRCWERAEVWVCFADVEEREKKDRNYEINKILECL